MLKKSTSTLTGNNRYEGFAVELIQRLAERLGFNYTFIMHKDDSYGYYNTETKVATGMIREIMVGVSFFLLIDSYIITPTLVSEC